MANQEHLALIKKGNGEWNRWRNENPTIHPDLSRAELSEFFLFGMNLSHANLSGTHLFKANLLGANLKDADLRNTDLRDAELIGANLTRANLSWAKLNWANLSKAKLIEATLNQADLSQANLHRTDFSRAKALGTNFSRAVLTDACIAQLEIDATTNLEGAIAECLFLQNSSDAAAKIIPDRLPEEFGRLLPQDEWNQFVQNMLESLTSRF
jgi:uncharacterized protein YjbI with pentapeptide repeats